MTLFYGSVDSSNILCAELLDEWQAKYPDQLTVVNVLSNEPEGSAWVGERGHVRAELFEKYAAPTEGSAAEKTGVFVCGPPPMYDAICGGRMENEVGGLLKSLGFEEGEVVKF